MSYSLYPHQIKAIKWLAPRKTGLLAYEMGLGKTCIAIYAAEAINAKKILVICPSVAMPNWQREFERWWPGSLGDVTLDVVSYGGLHKVKDQIAAAKLFCEKAWDVCIVDEAHYLKSAQASRTNSILAKGGILNYSSRAWCLSGTPCPNHAGELWPMLFTFGYTKLKYEQFVREFCDGYSFNKGHFKFSKFRIIGTKQAKIEELKEILKPFMLHETKQSVGLELPPIFYENVYIDEGFALARDQVGDAWAELERERDSFVSAAYEFGDSTDNALPALLSSLPTLRRFTGLQKIRYAAELLATELNSKNYDKIVVFCIHREVVTQIAARLKDFGAVYIHGEVRPDARQAAIDKFQEDPETRVMVANVQSAGVAINLTAANQIVFVEQDWVPGTNAQAVMRCHRIGMKNIPVTVRYLLLANNSIDEKITKTLRRKTEDIIALFSK